MYLLDTNVVSELRKREPDPNVLAWYATTASSHLFLSVITLGEIRLGIELLRRRKDKQQAEHLEQWLNGLVRSYQENIIGLDAAAADEWGRINAPSRLPFIEGLLAATARARDFTLVTRYTADVERSGVKLLNPFDPRVPGRQ